MESTKYSSHTPIPYILLFILLLSLPSCTTAKGYTGSGPVGLKTAVVRAHGVTFHTVNGIEVGATATGVEVLPGENEIRLTINASNFNDRGLNSTVYTLLFDAEPGKEYSVTGRRGDARLCAWEIDQNNGQPNFREPRGCISKQ